MDIFHSPKLCLKNAKGHILNFQTRIKAFSDSKPYAFVIEPDSHGINYLYKVKIAEPISDELTTIAFDIVNNLRTVLDQGWCTVAIVSQAISSSGEAPFPFADSVIKFENKLRRGCSKFHPDIISLVRSFKPYKGGNDLLWALNRICATDKHKILAPIAIIVGRIQMTNATLGNVAISAPQWDRRKNEIILASLGRNAKFRYENINITCDVIFDEIGVVSGKPAVAILRQLASIVEGILMAFEAESKRLGFIKT